MSLLSMITGREEIMHSAAGLTPLDRNLDCEILIIGGGILGVLTASDLRSKGFNVAVIDSREATPPGRRYDEMPFGFAGICLPENTGDSGRTRYNLMRECREKVELLICETGIECKLRNLHLMKVCRGTGGMEELAREFVTLEECGRSVEWLSSNALIRRYSVPAAAGGLKSPHGACMDVLDFTRSLLACLQRQGVVVHDDTRLEECRPEGGGYGFTSSRCHTVTCRKVIFTDPGTAHELCPAVSTRIIQKFRTITQPLPESVETWHQSAMFAGDHSSSLLVWMTQDRRLVIERKEPAGAGHRPAEDTIADSLCGAVREWLPDLDLTPEFVSSTPSAHTADGLPLAGCVPGMPGVYTALGTDCHLVEASLLASEILSSSAAGVYHPAIEHFRFPTDIMYPDSLAT